MLASAKDPVCLFFFWGGGGLVMSMLKFKWLFVIEA